MIAGAPVRLFNSLGRKFIDFRPMVEGRVGVYSCGPTVYSHPHLGNMRPYVFSDTLRRLLTWKGLEVTQVVNITDVGHAVGDGDVGEDKVELAARRELRSVHELTSHYTTIFLDDMRALNVLPATAYPRASEYVPRMIEFARVLQQRGFTYTLPSGLYFDTSRSQGYGRLALMPADGRREGVRGDVVEGKRSPADFAVWRTDAPGERRIMRWDSPWGPGVPGWHLECSVMSMDLLGGHFDIHTGGVDHREIHHVNEIAQSEAYLGDGRDWVPLWLHNEFLLFGSQKMSKSGGHTTRLADLAKDGFHPMSYRYFLQTAHYRSQLDLTESGLTAAATAYRRLLSRVAPLRPLPDPGPLAAAPAGLDPAARAALERIDEQLSDDLKTPGAIAELHTLLADERVPEADRAWVVAAADSVLGLRLGDLDPDEVAVVAGELSVPAAEVEELLGERERARAGRRWAEADAIRERLADLGVRVTDTADGPRWSFVGTPAGRAART